MNPARHLDQRDAARHDEAEPPCVPREAAEEVLGERELVEVGEASEIREIPLLPASLQDFKVILQC